MNSVSFLNQYCQQHKIDFPVYTMGGCKGMWSCHCRFKIDNDERLCSTNLYPTKKEAKEAAAGIIISLMPSQPKIMTIPKDNYYLIDADQRMDCWNFLINETNASSDTFDIEVFTSPTTPIPSGNRFTINQAKTACRDSADANILMALGDLFYRSEFGPSNIVVISSDHILVQTCIDYGFVCIPNLACFKEWLTANPGPYSTLV